MKRVWSDRKGVSPVIATILMVAITVVLAAVLYVMVTGLISTPSSTNTPISGTAKLQSTTATITVTIASAPANAAISTSTVTVISSGVPYTVTASLYTAGGKSNGNYWTTASVGAWGNVTVTTFAAGMTMSLTPYGSCPAFAVGMKVQISGTGFSLSQITVSA